MNKPLNQLIEFTKNLTLLYIEDDQSSREQTLSILKLFFTKIVIAVDGEDGVSKYNSNKIDFIITDINMPKLNGIDMIGKIREVNKYIPIIIVSAHSDTNFFLDSIKVGVDGYLIKPLQSEQFIYQISKNLHSLYLQNQIKEEHLNLEQRVTKQVEELREKDKILIQQTKLATMGEMMDIIAHQWKQPINIIAMNTALIWELYGEYEIPIDPKDIQKCYTSVNIQVKHLVKTLDDFRKFFRPNEAIETISLKTLLDSVLVLIHDDLIKNLITVDVDCDGAIELEVNVSEIQHIFINLINNSKDAFNQHDIKNRKITISCKKNKNKVKVDVTDNAGGIPKNIIDKIFEPNFTTKSTIGGTGIGLYMSQFIAKKNSATIDVQNVDNGVNFTLKFKKA
jgi:signal transduction histidine kinase